MRILITGATGLVGSKLIETLYRKGYDDIHVLTRNPQKAEENSPFPIKAFEWNPSQQTINKEAFSKVDAVIHLAGESVAEGRWTQAKKERILNSRVNGTKLVVDTIKTLPNSPKKLISASAIGIYGNRNSEQLDAKSSLGDDYLADVCKKWEDLALNHDIDSMKSQCIRIGIVLSNKGGALKKMLPPFKAGVAGNLGNGKQYMSWIHIDDLVNQFIFLLENDGKSKIYNGVSPRPIMNKDFTKILGKQIKRPTLFPVPSFMLKLIFGEMSDILLNSQNVLPQNFIDEGFKFQYDTLGYAFAKILKHDLKGEDVLQKYQVIKKNLNEVFDFFSDEKNLEKITPPYLNFKVLKKSTPQIEPGTLIDYKLKLHGIPIKWQSKISSFDKGISFVDEQVRGPYSKWHHTHDFITLKSGDTLISDRVIYKAPLGVVGRVFSGPFIKKDLKNIFNYRKKVIGQFFS